MNQLIGEITLKKEEFMKMIEDCNLTKNIDQKLLDEASVMMTK